MNTSFLKIAIRNIIKYNKFSIINILGLAIGLGCFLLIMLWVQDELSYDGFHKNADNIYMALRTHSESTMGVTSISLAPALKDELPEVIEATSFIPFTDILKPFIQYQDKGFEEKLNIVDPQFFNLFSFDFKDGNPQTALLNPNSIVLTASMANKYFGNTNVLGKSLNLTLVGQKGTFKVTGILENIPHNSHIKQKIFIPMSYVINILKPMGITDLDHWNNHNARTYILMQSDIDMTAVERKITACERKYMPNQQSEMLSYSLLPLKKLHLHANNIKHFSATGDIKYVYITKLNH